MLITRALYGLKSAGKAFRAHLAETFYDMGFIPSLADPDVWMRSAVKEDGFKYWEYILAYVDDVLCISHQPLSTMKRLQESFKMKGDKIEKPTDYLGAALSQFENSDGVVCWAMSADKYCKAFVDNIEDALAKKNLRLPGKCVSPMTHGYRPEMDCTAELKSEGI